MNRLQVDDDGQPLMEGIFSNYNDDIVVEAEPQTLVGRYDAARGPVQTIGLGGNLYFEDGKLFGWGGGVRHRRPQGPVGPQGPEGPAGASSSRFFYHADFAVADSERSRHGADTLELLADVNVEQAHRR